MKLNVVIGALHQVHRVHFGPSSENPIHLVVATDDGPMRVKHGIITYERNLPDDDVARWDHLPWHFEQVTLEGSTPGPGTSTSEDEMIPGKVVTYGRGMRLVPDWLVVAIDEHKPRHGAVQAEERPILQHDG